MKKILFYARDLKDIFRLTTYKGKLKLVTKILKISNGDCNHHVKNIQYFDQKEGFLKSFEIFLLR